MDTDGLGMALSLNSTIPSTTAFVKLIRSLCKETGNSLVFSALRVGLLSKRHSIPTEKWKSIKGHFDKIPKKKTLANKLEIVPFEYFDDDYIPTDVVSYILQYLYVQCQCKVNTGIFSQCQQARTFIYNPQKQSHDIFEIKQHMTGQSHQNYNLLKKDQTLYNT